MQNTNYNTIMYTYIYRAVRWCSAVVSGDDTLSCLIYENAHKESHDRRITFVTMKHIKTSGQMKHPQKKSHVHKPYGGLVFDCNAQMALKINYFRENFCEAWFNDCLFDQNLTNFVACKKNKNINLF